MGGLLHLGQLRIVGQRLPLILVQLLADGAILTADIVDAIELVDIRAAGALHIHILSSQSAQEVGIPQ